MDNMKKDNVKKREKEEYIFSSLFFDYLACLNRDRFPSKWFFFSPSSIDFSLFSFQNGTLERVIDNNKEFASIAFSLNDSSFFYIPLSHTSLFQFLAGGGYKFPSWIVAVEH